MENIYEIKRFGRTNAWVITKIKTGDKIDVFPTKALAERALRILMATRASRIELP